MDKISQIIFGYNPVITLIVIGIIVAITTACIVYPKVRQQINQNPIGFSFIAFALLVFLATSILNK